MFMTRDIRNYENESNLEVYEIFFQQLHDYFGDNINNRNYIHNENKLYLKAGNRCYFTISYL